MIKTIKNSIVNLINNNLVGSNKAFNAVYSYYTDEWASPYVCVEFTDFSAETASNRANKRTYTYNLIIVQQIHNITREKGKELLDDQIDKIIKLFDENYTLWLNNILFVRPVGGTVGTSNNNKWIILFAAIKLDVETLKDYI